jgi:hypothetical protein
MTGSAKDRLRYERVEPCEPIAAGDFFCTLSDANISVKWRSIRMSNLV